REGGQSWELARTVRRRDPEPPSRLPPLVVGDVLADAVGLDDVLRYPRSLRHALLPVRAGAADDLDLRDARDRAGRADQGSLGVGRGASGEVLSHEREASNLRLDGGVRRSDVARCRGGTD